MITLYVLKDLQAKTTNNPFAQTTERDAVHGLRMAVNDEQNKGPLTTHPQDFELWQIGTYCPRTMEFEKDQYRIISAEEVKNKTE
jgi:hypothetical protein